MPPSYRLPLCPRRFPTASGSRFNPPLSLQYQTRRVLFDCQIAQSLPQGADAAVNPHDLAKVIGELVVNESPSILRHGPLWIVG